MIYQFKNYQPPEILHGHLNLGGSNPAGERIDVNSLYVERGGKPWIAVMGEIHYVRCRREKWREILCKMKAGGIRVIATYAFWIYHEEEEGIFDFAGARDVRAFVQLCGELGLDVVMRVGPWCHGEVRNGGFPDWLLKKPYPLREVNDEFLGVTKRWFQALAAQLAGLYYKDGGSIIAVQIENEYVDNADYLYAVKQLAIECGMIAPLYTVTGWNRASGAKIPVDEVLPLFGGYCDAPWDSSVKKLPPSSHYFFTGVRNDSSIGKDLIAAGEEEDGWRLPYERYPHATCELGGGLESTYLRRYQIKGMDIYTVALIKLCEGTNLIGYYMYYGGVNLLGKRSTLQESKATGYPNDYPILSYDFEAPLSMYGEVREHYRLLNLLHLFVEDFGEMLAAMSFVPAAEAVGRDDRKSLRYAMRTDGKRGFVFVSHYQRLDALEDVKDVVLAPLDVTFPAIDVKGDTAFFFPVHMPLGSMDLAWATAQPLCRMRNTYFFVEQPGIAPQYCVDGRLIDATAGRAHGYVIGDCCLVTLTQEEALYTRRLAGALYIGDHCDLYWQDDTLRAVQAGSQRAYRFRQEIWADGERGTDREMPTDGERGTDREMPTDSGFGVCRVIYEEICLENPIEDATCVLAAIEEAPFAVPRELLAEFYYGGENTLQWYRLEVTGTTGYVTIDLPCDVMQVYADETLLIDEFYRGAPLRVPAEQLLGRDCYLLASAWKDGGYREYDASDLR